MSGIYVHVPFCKKACHYCNFHFSTSLGLKDQMVDAICAESEIRKDYLSEKNLRSIYFGGGTPGMLSAHETGKILNTLAKFFSWDDTAEVTLEANPDDLTIEKLRDLRSLGINRLSIGVQSFFNEDLVWMGRVHDAERALACIGDARDTGFENLTIDLIYGSPASNHETWSANMKTAIDLQIPHISAYCLTVEEKTALSHFIKTGKNAPPDPQKTSEYFDMLMDAMQDAGYIHYEISNFAKPGNMAIHNTGYWEGIPYLGLGPSAHSFDGVFRSWNVANNKKYIDSILSGILPSETEKLTLADQYNEYIMTGLRTMIGVDVKRIKNFGTVYSGCFLSGIGSHIAAGNLIQTGDNYLLTQAGKHFADRISMELFYTD